MPQPTDETATAREDLCRLLAACWYEPDISLTQARPFESLIAAAQRLGPALEGGARRAGEAYASTELPQLQHEYRRLFGDPGAATAPHESCWRAGDDDDGEACAMALLGLYQAAGFELDEDDAVPPDHVALELEFLWVVTAKEHEAQRAGSAEVLASWRLLRAGFLRQHLGAWIHRFAQEVHARATTPFYRELAQLTALFVAAETSALAAA